MSTYQWKHCKNNKTKKKCIQTKPKYCRETKRSPINKFGTECIQRKENTNNYYETCTEPFLRDLTFQTSAPKRLPRGNILWTHEKVDSVLLPFDRKHVLRFRDIILHYIYSTWKLLCNLDKWTWNKNHGHKINRYWSFQSSTYS